jgi:uncharacterized membrane protein YqjE
MWKSLIKFLAVLWLKNRMEFIRNNFFNKLNTNSNDDLTKLKETIAVLAESRAAIFKHNFNHEINRVVNSLFGFMLILLAAILSLLTGLAWLFALAWTSPNRDLILSITMLLPVLIAVAVYFYIRQSWQKQALFQQSILQVESDWQLFRDGFDGLAQKTTAQKTDAQKNG